MTSEIENMINKENMEYYREKVEHIREYVKVMKDEPDEYILLSRIYHDLRRILGDE